MAEFVFTGTFLEDFSAELEIDPGGVAGTDAPAYWFSDGTAQRARKFADISYAISHPNSSAYLSLAFREDTRLLGTIENSGITVTLEINDRTITSVITGDDWDEDSSFYFKELESSDYNVFLTTENGVSYPYTITVSDGMSGGEDLSNGSNESVSISEEHLLARAIFSSESASIAELEDHSAAKLSSESAGIAESEEHLLARAHFSSSSESASIAELEEHSATKLSSESAGIAESEEHYVPRAHSSSSSESASIAESEEHLISDTEESLSSQASESVGIAEGEDHRSIPFNLGNIYRRGHVSSRDFDLFRDNTNPTGIAIADGFAYVPDEGLVKVFVYELSSTGATYRSSRDFDLDDDNTGPRGIAISNGFAYVPDDEDGKVYVYELSSTGATRRASRDFSLFGDNGSPTGIGIDGGFAYITDDSGTGASGDGKVYVYELSSTGATYRSSRSFDLFIQNANPRSIAFDGSTAYCADFAIRPTTSFAYDLAEDGAVYRSAKTFFALDGAQVGIAIYESLAFIASPFPDLKVRAYDYSLLSAIPEYEATAISEVEQHGLDIVSSHSEQASIAEEQESETRFVGIVSRHSESISATESRAERFEKSPLLPGSIEVEVAFDSIVSPQYRSVRTRPVTLPESWLSAIVPGERSRQSLFFLAAGAAVFDGDFGPNLQSIGERLKDEITRAEYTISIDGLPDLTVSTLGLISPFSFRTSERDRQAVSSWVDLFIARFGTAGARGTFAIRHSHPPLEPLRISESSTQTLRSGRFASEGVSAADEEVHTLARSLSGAQSEALAISEASAELPISTDVESASISESMTHSIEQVSPELVRLQELSGTESELLRRQTDDTLVAEQHGIAFQRGTADSSFEIGTQEQSVNLVTKVFVESVAVGEARSGVAESERGQSESASLHEREFHVKSVHHHSSHSEDVGVVEAGDADIPELHVNNIDEGISATDAEAHRSSLREWQAPRQWEGKSDVGLQQADRTGEQLQAYRRTFTDEISVLLRETLPAKAQKEGDLFVAEGENLIGVIPHEPGEDKAYRVKDGQIAIIDRGEIEDAVFPTLNPWEIITGDKDGNPERLRPAITPADGPQPIDPPELWFLSLVDRTVVWQRQDGFVAFQRTRATPPF